MNRMLVTITVAGVLLAGFALARSAFAAAPAQVQDTEMGQVLADTEGLTLYTFDKDAVGRSNCVDKCADSWPPHYAGDDAKDQGNYTVISRTDGTKQWAYKGKPLYLWMEDEEPGDVKGQGKNGTWHAARP